MKNFLITINIIAAIFFIFVGLLTTGIGLLERINWNAINKWVSTISNLQAGTTELIIGVILILPLCWIFKK